jgi:Arc/MetJ-type ribon-helix-helix transcriptional regulator
MGFDYTDPLDLVCFTTMNLTLNPEIERRITEQVRLGRFPTPEAVVEAAVVELTEPDIDDSLDADDIAAINEAEAQIDRGEGIDLATLRAEMSKRFVKP